MAIERSRVKFDREAVPFRVVDADGQVTELTYSSPRIAAEHDEVDAVSQLPWFDAGQPLHNWMSSRASPN